MISLPMLMAALAATALAQAPSGYGTVYITSLVDKKFVVVPKAPVKVGAGIVVQTITNKPEQQWYIQAGKSKIQLRNSTLCIDAGAKSNWKDMGSISLQTCSDTADGQKWNVMADGRIALELSNPPQECIDLQYMRATQNNPVGLYTCAGLGNTGAADKGINWPLLNANGTT